jgi:hypothetical protein
MLVRHGVSFGCTKRWTGSRTSLAASLKDASAWNERAGADPFKKSFANNTGRLKGGLLLSPALRSPG